MNGAIYYIHVTGDNIFLRYLTWISNTLPITVPGECFKNKQDYSKLKKQMQINDNSQNHSAEDEQNYRSYSIWLQYLL